MKLISCHIENFGCLKNYDVVFENLTQIYEKNGYGKSTFAAFIKAMFYPMKTVSARTSSFVEREHYYPFYGGKFGGSITFELGGKTYTVERFFDKKSASGDSVTVYADGVKCENTDDFTGDSLFKIDEESFMRTVFVTPDNYSSGTTHGINDKINGISDSYTEDNLKKAIESLEKESKIIAGRNGKITAVNNRIKELEKRLNETENLKKMTAEKYDERKRLCVLRSEKEELKKKETGKYFVYKNRETYNSWISAAEEQKLSYGKIMSSYPHGIPDSKITEKLAGLAENAASSQRIAQHESSGDDEERLSELLKFFKGEVPDGESCENLKKIAADIENNLKIADGFLPSEEEKKEYERLSEIFTKEIPEHEKREEISRKAAKAAELKGISENMRREAEKNFSEYAERFEGKADKNTVEELDRAYNEFSQAQKNENNTVIVKDFTCKRKGPKALTVIVLIAAAAAVCAGIYILVNKSLKTGIIITAAAAAAAVIYGFVSVLRKISETAKEEQIIAEAKKEELRRETYEKKADLAAMLKIFGMRGENTERDYITLRENINIYLGRREEYEKAAKEIEKIEKEAADITAETEEFRKKYIPEVFECTPAGFDDYNNSASRCKRLGDDIKEANAKRADFLKKASDFSEEFEKKIAVTGADVSDCVTYEEKADKITEIASEIRSLESKEKERISKKSAAEKNAKEASEEFESIIGKYGIHFKADETFYGLCNRLDADRQTAEYALNNFNDAFKKAAEFAEKNDIGKENFEEIPDPEKFNEEISGLYRQISDKEKEIDDLETEISNESEYRLEAEELKEEYENLEYKNKILTKTKELLLEADESIRIQYVMPVQERFEKYIKTAEKTLGEKFYIDKNFNIMYERGGERRSDCFLSSGQKTAEALCLRFAVTDVLFEKGEKPFMILDDPFVYVDGEHMKKHTELLKMLSEKYQIIYFCCHESRKLDLHKKMQ